MVSPQNGRALNRWTSQFLRTRASNDSQIGVELAFRTPQREIACIDSRERKRSLTRPQSLDVTRLGCIVFTEFGKFPQRIFLEYPKEDFAKRRRIHAVRASYRYPRT